MVQLALTGLVGLLAALQPAIAASQRNPGSSDPATCIADNKLYRTGRTYRMNGGDYIVRCARDSTGNVLSSQIVMWGGFATCFNVCERTKNCAGFTYVGSRDSGTCYLKSSLGGYPASTDDLVTCEKSPDKEPGRDPEPLPSSSWTSVEPPRTTSSSWYSEASTTRSDLNTFSPTDVSTTAPAPTPSANECQQAVKQYGEVYRGGSGSAYQLSCGTDHYGGDLNDAGSSSFIGCVAVCDSKPDCIGYAYTPGNCWLKNYLTAKEVNSGVDFAINLERNATAKPRSSTTASPSSTAPTPKAGSCGFVDSKTLTSSANNRYTIECGADYNGGDIGGGPANTFIDCADICDKVDKCIGYAWAGANGGNGPGTCYLKGTVTNRETNPNVDYAYKDVAIYLPSSSSSSSRSHPPTSTSVVTPVSTSSTSSHVKPNGTERPPPPPKETTSSTSTRSAYTPPRPPPKETTSSTSALSTYTPSPPPPKETTSSTSSAPVTNPVSTSCRTITFSTSGTTRVSTVTDYVSKSYTHIEWITSTTSNSAVPSTTSKPATTTSKPTTLSTTPSSKPPTPTKPGNEDHCKRLRGQKPMKLRIQVIDGDRKFHNTWLKDPPVPNDVSLSIAQLCSSWEEAASIFLHPVTNALMSWHDKETCDFWGLNLFPAHGKKGGHGRGRGGRLFHEWDSPEVRGGGRRRPHHREGFDPRPFPGSGNDAYAEVDSPGRHENTGSAVFLDNEGSGSVFDGNKGIERKHESFGGWLACNDGPKGAPELRFWDVSDGKHAKYHAGCSRVRLRLE